MASLLILLACNEVEPVVEACTSCGGDCLADSTPNRGQAHKDGDLDYTDDPPASGDHSGCWGPWGVQETELPPENWVHNLEHGGVVLLYSCTDLCDGELETLTAWAETLPVGRMILTSYPTMSWRYAAVSWQHRLMMNCLDTEAMQHFFDDHVGLAPENIISPPPASCEDTAAGGGM